MRIVLPSNSSMQFFPNNSLAKYTVKLPKHLDFSDGKWEVGLMEVMFYKSWHNLRDGAKIHLEREDGGEGGYTVNIPAGYYPSMSALCQKLNECMRRQLDARMRSAVSFKFDEQSRLTMVSVNAVPGFKIVYSDVLEDIFKSPLPNVRGVGTRWFYTKAELPEIRDVMVYSDIVTPCLVGDTETNLLRVVPVQGEHWRMQWTPFTKIQYIPVSQSTTSTITIYLYTDWGEPVPFTDGRTTVTLDIRKVL